MSACEAARKTLHSAGYTGLSGDKAGTVAEHQFTECPIASDFVRPASLCDHNLAAIPTADFFGFRAKSNGDWPMERLCTSPGWLPYSSPRFQCGLCGFRTKLFGTADGSVLQAGF